MGLQKYRADEARPASPNGAVEWITRWIGGRTLAKVANCPCDDGRRRVAYVTGEADTYFSMPAAVSIRGKRAVGYLTGTEGGPQFCFMDETLKAFGLSRVILDEVTGEKAEAQTLGETLDVARRMALEAIAAVEGKPEGAR